MIARPSCVAQSSPLHLGGDTVVDRLVARALEGDVRMQADFFSALLLVLTLLVGLGGRTRGCTCGSDSRCPMSNTARRCIHDKERGKVSTAPAEDQQKSRTGLDRIPGRAHICNSAGWT